MQIPDAEQLIAQLATAMRPHITPDTALVGIHTGGLWLAQRLHALLGSLALALSPAASAAPIGQPPALPQPVDAADGRKRAGGGHGRKLTEPPPRSRIVLRNWKAGRCQFASVLDR